jgi:uncharacterized protein with von Willebrand factor type A (vWA) domain
MMSHDDLLKLLDLDGADAGPAPADPLADAPAGGEKGAANPNAMDVDEWTGRRGEDLAAERPDAGLTPEDLADFHAAAFDADPTLLPACADPRKHAYLAQLMETPEYQSLRTSTLLNEAAASLAALRLGEAFAGLKAEDAAKEKAKPAPAKMKPGRGTAKPGDDMAEEMRLLRAVAGAVAEAADDVAELEDLASACGMGGEGGRRDPKRIAELFRRVRSSAKLRRIMELAGRYRMVAQSKQRRKTTHGMDDLVGVTLDGEVGRLVASELARLALPETELDALRRVVERQAMCRDHRASEPVGKGPIIVAVDESGSMHGDKVDTAKALALALAWVARRQRRWCGLVAYSGDTGHRLLALPPGGWDEVAVLGWLEPFLGGGSSLDVPVREMPEFYRRLGAPAGRTDVVFVTDAICHIPAAIKESFLAWKAAAKARLVTLVIESQPGDLEAVSDEVHSVANLDADREEVGRVLSL